MNMATIKLETPDKYKEYLDDSNEFQSVITEVMFDYVEKKQDEQTKKLLNSNLDFQKINNSLNQKLWEL